MACPDCFRGGIQTGEPKGRMQDLYGYKTYITLPPDNPTPKSTIIFFCDAFGLNLPNNLLLADRYAAEANCRVVAPDIIPSGPAPLAVLDATNSFMRLPSSYLTYLNPLFYLSKAWNLTTMLACMSVFVFRGGHPSRGLPACLAFARRVRADLDPGGKLGAAGFCWGGFPSTKLCAEPAVEGGTEPLLDAQFCAHPSFLSAPDDIVRAVETFGVPYSCAVAEFDMMVNKSVAEQTEATLRRKLGDGVGTYEFRVYDGCHHSFAVRSSWDEGEVAMKGYEGAAKQAVEWFSKHLN